MSLNERQAEIDKVIKKYPLTYPITLVLVLLVVGIWIGANLFGKGGLLGETDNGYTVNLYTEIISVIGTVGIIEVLNRHREEKRRERDLRDQLIRNAGSTSNEIAKDAVHQLRKREWLLGDTGLLKSQNLKLANLQDANLTHANLQGADLLVANLRGAHLQGANLEAASLPGAYLQGTVLVMAHLQRAQLALAQFQGALMWEANLRGADLSGANLHGANLRDANLEEVKLDGTKYDSETTLPDYSQWALDTDMRRFTDRSHPHFWRSDNWPSPAYRGNDTQ